jgi:hypothetical protein
MYLVFPLRGDGQQYYPGYHQRRPDRAKLERQIGRLLGQNARAAGLFDVQVTEGPAGRGLRAAWTQHPEWQEWATLSEGHYLLQSNLQG